MQTQRSRVNTKFLSCMLKDIKRPSTSTNKAQFWHSRTRRNDPDRQLANYNIPRRRAEFPIRVSCRGTPFQLGLGPQVARQWKCPRAAMDRARFHQDGARRHTRGSSWRLRREGVLSNRYPVLSGRIITTTNFARLVFTTGSTDEQIFIITERKILRVFLFSNRSSLRHRSQFDVK